MEPTVRVDVQTRINEFIKIKIKLSDTLASFKNKILEQTEVPIAQQGIVYAGKMLDNDNLSLNDHGIEEMSKVHLVLRLRGGCDNANGICTCGKQNTAN